MDLIMQIASVAGVLTVGVLLLLACLPSGQSGAKQAEKFLPPLHGGYKPRPGTSPKRTNYPTPPPGRGGGSQRSTHEEGDR